MEDTIDTIFSISDFILDIPKDIKVTNSRNELLHELYILYTSQPEELRKENRKRYRLWMHNNHPEHCRKIGFDFEKYNSFKEEFKKQSKAKKIPEGERFYGYPKENTYAWYGKFTHLKEEIGMEALIDLLHNARDAYHRGYNVSKFINSKLKVK